MGRKIEKTKPNTIKKIPKVSYWYFFLNLRKFVANPIPSLQELHAKYGDTFRLNMGFYNSIISINPDVNQHILQKNQRNYAKSPLQTDLLAEYLGLGLLTLNGDYWLRQRRLIQPGFHKQKLASLMDIMQDEIEQSTLPITKKIELGEAIDMREVGLVLAFKLVARSLFSNNMAADQMEYLANSLTAIQAFLIKNIRMQHMKPWFKLSGQEAKYKKMAKEMADLVMKFVHERRASGAEIDDLLDMLLKARYEDTGEGMSDQQLKDECIVLFVAGHETTANAISWIFYLLGQHPEIIEKLRLEYQNVLEDRKPTIDDLRQLEYTNQVINEGMRMYPPAWITDRVALEEDFINGYKIKKGAIVATYIYGAHHDKSLWDDPEVFRPERFEKSKHRARHNFAFFPFGGGPRLCIGNNFALMELQLVLIHFIRQYDFTLVPNQDIKMEPLVTLRPDREVMIDFKKR